MSEPLCEHGDYAEDCSDCAGTCPHGEPLTGCPHCLWSPREWQNLVLYDEYRTFIEWEALPSLDVLELSSALDEAERWIFSRETRHLLAPTREREESRFDRLARVAAKLLAKHGVALHWTVLAKMVQDELSPAPVTEQEIYAAVNRDKTRFNGLGDGIYELRKDGRSEEKG